METKTYGLLIDRENRYGTEYVTASAMARDGDSAYPVGLNGIFSSLDGSAKHQRGLTIDGLKMRGHFYDGADGWRMIGFEPEYYDVYNVDLRKAQAMVKTLARVNKRIERDGSSEAGDILRSVCDALRLEWVVERVGTYHGTEWRDCDWCWHDIGDGRRRLRSLIEEATPKADAA